jgi:hypothetical protein
VKIYSDRLRHSCGPPGRSGPGAAGLPARTRRPEHDPAAVTRRRFQRRLPRDSLVSRMSRTATARRRPSTTPRCRRLPRVRIRGARRRRRAHPGLRRRDMTPASVDDSPPTGCASGTGVHGPVVALTRMTNTSRASRSVIGQGCGTGCGSGGESPAQHRNLLWTEHACDTRSPSDHHAPTTWDSRARKWETKRP